MYDVLNFPSTINKINDTLEYELYAKITMANDTITININITDPCRKLAKLVKIIIFTLNNTY